MNDNTCTLGDIADIVMGQSPKGETCNNSGEGLPLLNGPTEFTFYSPEPVQWTTDAKKVCNNGDVLFCVRGSTTGRMNWADQEYAIGRGLAAIRHKKGQEFNEYIRAMIEYKLGEILKSATGTTFPNVSKDLLSSVEIPAISLEEQLRISKLLGIINRKIVLNSKLNDNLEEVKRELFKAWFINYIPFQGEGMEESELGMKPVNWKVETLGEVTTNIRTKVDKRQLTVFSAVNTGKLALSEEYFTKQVFSKDIGKYIVVEENDFAYNPARVNIGSIGINNFGYAGCVSPVYVVFRTEEGYHNFFNMFIKSARFKKEVETRSSGSVRQAMNYKDFEPIQIVYPPQDVIEKFNDIYMRIDSSIQKIKRNCNSLKNLRDILLPKLMKGEIDLSKIELEIL